MLGDRRRDGAAAVHTIMDAVLAADITAIKKHAAAIAWANEPIGPILSNPELFAQINIQMEKLRIEAAGYCKPGPVRSPYNEMPQQYADACRECGHRWASLCKD